MAHAKEVQAEAAAGVKAQAKATKDSLKDAEGDASRRMSPLVSGEKKKLKALEGKFVGELKAQGEQGAAAFKEAQEEMGQEADKTDASVSEMKMRLNNLMAGIKQTKGRFNTLISTESQNVHGLENKLKKETDSDSSEYDDLKHKVEAAINDAESKSEGLAANSKQSVDGWVKNFGTDVDEEVQRVDERAEKLEANEDKQARSAIGAVNSNLQRLEGDSQGLEKDVGSEQTEMTKESNALAHEGVAVTGALKADHAAAHSSMVGAQEAEVGAVDGELDSAKSLAKGARDLEAGAQAAYDGLAQDFSGKFSQTDAQVKGFLADDEAKIHAAHEEEDSAGRRATFEETQLTKEIKSGEKGLTEAEQEVKNWQDSAKQDLDSERASTTTSVDDMQKAVSKSLVKHASGVYGVVNNLWHAGIQLDAQLNGQEARAASFDRDLAKVASFEHNHAESDIQDLESESDVLNFQGQDLLGFARHFANSDLSFKTQLRDKFHEMDVVMDGSLLKTIEGIHGDMLDATGRKTKAHKAFEDALTAHEVEQKQALADLYLKADSEIARIQADDSLDAKTKEMLIKQVRLTSERHATRIMSNDGTMNDDLEKLTKMINKGIMLAQRLQGSKNLENATAAERIEHMKGNMDALKGFSWFSLLQDGGGAEDAADAKAADAQFQAARDADTNARLRALDDELVSGDAELERLVGAYAP